MKKFFIAISIMTFTVCSMSQTVIIMPEYSNARGFSEGMAAVSKDNKWGFIDVKGDIVIAIQYLDVRDFHEGKAAIRTENGWGYINKENLLIIPDKFFDARDFSEGVAAVKITDDNIRHGGYGEEKYGDASTACWQYINEEGKSAFRGMYRGVSTFNNGVACVLSDKYWDLINKEGEVILNTHIQNPYPIHYSAGLVPKMGGILGDDWGYCDLSGKFVVEPQYRCVSEFCDGIAVVQEYGGQEFVIDNTGEKIYTGKRDKGLVILKNGFIMDGEELYHKSDFSKPYFVFKNDYTYKELTYQWNEIITLPSIHLSGSTITVSDKIRDKIIDVIQDIKPLFYNHPNEGLWMTRFDNGLIGYTALKMNDFISQYVDSHMTEWLKRDEFESSSVYEKRTSEENRHKQMVLFADDLINNWLKKRLDQWTLSDYNADKESFELTTDFGKYTIKVPTGNARMLKNNWSSTTKQVGFKYDNGFNLAKIDFIVSLGNKDVTLSVNTATGTIESDNHDDINKELPNIKWIDFIANATSKECPIKLGVFSKSKIETVTVTVNGVQDRGIKTVNSSDYDMTINRTLTLNEGANVIKVSVRNAAGTAQEEKAIVYRPQGGELPNIEWLDFTATANKKEYQVKLGIKSKTKVEEVNMTVNGELSGNIKTEITDGYNLTADKTLSLSEGQNRIVVSVRNADGISTSEKVITYRGNSPTPVFNEKRIALVIGNSNYQGNVNPLTNPRNDAEDISAKLKSLGFETNVLYDGTRKGMDEAIGLFIKQAKGYDVALFYYAGHGLQLQTNIGGNNYLIPVDAQLEYDTDAMYQCVNANQLVSQMEASGCNVRLVVLDACRDLPNLKVRNRGSSSKGFADMNPERGTYIMYSTREGKTASDGMGRHSPFAEGILKYIDEPVKIEDFFKHVGEWVDKVTNNKQDPWSSGRIVGDFYFNRQ